MARQMWREYFRERYNLSHFVAASGSGLGQPLHLLPAQLQRQHPKQFVQLRAAGGAGDGGGDAGLGGEPGESDLRLGGPGLPRDLFERGPARESCAVR